MMIMGAFIPGLRRKYPAHEYFSAILLVVGLILFTLADAHTSPNFSAIGVVMVSGALIMDSFLGNFQEAIFTMNPETTQVCSALLSPFFSLFYTKDFVRGHGFYIGVLFSVENRTEGVHFNRLSFYCLVGKSISPVNCVSTSRVYTCYMIFSLPLWVQIY